MSRDEKAVSGSEESPQGPPVMQVSRPLTFSSGLWNDRDASSPVHLPPLQIPVRVAESASHLSSSASVSPKGSAGPPSESRSEVLSYGGFRPPREGFSRGESDLSRIAAERGTALPQVLSQESSRNIPHHSPYRQSRGESGSIPQSPAAPHDLPHLPPEAYGRGYPIDERATGGYTYPEPIAHPPQRIDLSSQMPHAPRLVIRQQPIAARACGFGERDRRLVDPPPILQLTSQSQPRDSSVLLATHVSTRFSVVQASLWDESGQYDVTFAQPTNRKPGSRLMGTTFTTSINAKDDTDKDGIFFAFPDLSCRTYGRFRLRFALMMIDASKGHIGSTAPVVDYALSEPFTVYSASDFPGMRPSTRLTKALRESGCAIPVKKGRRSVFGAALSDEEGEGEGEGEPDVKPSKRAREGKP